ncbi:hypothetical protein TNCV_23401 [Trichonephila clavipes]|nr:hypothetical protein TNCV_23401 [Trichonephila clavipes]
MAQEDHHFPIKASRNRDVTASQLSHELCAVTRSRVSRATVSRRLQERGLFKSRPIVCIALSSTNRRVNLKWINEGLFSSQMSPDSV